APRGDEYVEIMSHVRGDLHRGFPARGEGERAQFRQRLLGGFVVEQLVFIRPDRDVDAQRCRHSTPESAVKAHTNSHPMVSDARRWPCSRLQVVVPICWS